MDKVRRKYALKKVLEWFDSEPWAYFLNRRCKTIDYCPMCKDDVCRFEQECLSSRYSVGNTYCTNYFSNMAAKLGIPYWAAVYKYVVQELEKLES